MLQNFRDNLALGARVLFAHRPVHQLHDVLVEVRNEIVEIFFVGFGVEALATDPFNRISASWNNRILWFLLRNFSIFTLCEMLLQR